MCNNNKNWCKLNQRSTWVVSSMVFPRCIHDFTASLTLKYAHSAVWHHITQAKNYYLPHCIFDSEACPLCKLWHCITQANRYYLMHCILNSEACPLCTMWHHITQANNCYLTRLRFTIIVDYGFQNFYLTQKIFCSYRMIMFNYAKAFSIPSCHSSSYSHEFIHLELYCCNV